MPFDWSQCKSSSDSRNNSAASVNGILASLNEMINCPVPQLLVCGHVSSLQGSVCWWGRAAATCHGPAYPAAVKSENVKSCQACRGSNTWARPMERALTRPQWYFSNQDYNRWNSLPHTRIWCCTVISWAPYMWWTRFCYWFNNRRYLHVCLQTIYYYKVGNWIWMTRGDGGKNSLFSFVHVWVLCCVPVKTKGFISRKMRSINQCANLKHCEITKSITQQCWFMSD